MDIVLLLALERTTCSWSLSGSAFQTPAGIAWISWTILLFYALAVP